MRAHALSTADSTRRIAVGLFLLLASIYALTGGGHTSSPDEEGMLAQARALASGSWDIAVDETNESVTSRRVLDDGRAVGVSNLGPSIAVLPLLGLGSVVADVVPEARRIVVENLFALFTNSLVTAATAVLLFRLSLLLGAPRRRGALLALAYGLGTYAWPHARTFFSEPLTALLLLGAVLSSAKASEGERWTRAAAAGLCAGLAANVRISAAIFAPLVGLYLLGTVWHRRGSAAAVRLTAVYGGAVLACVALLLATNVGRYGSAFDFGPSSLPFDFPLWQGLFNLYFSPGKSLFLYAPLVGVALVAVPIGLRRRPAETLLLMAIVAANSIAFGRFLAWHGDQAWGPRYLHIILPCAVALMSPALAGGVRWARAVAVAGVIGFVGPGALGVLIYPNAYFQQGNAEPSLTGIVEANGERRYINAFHFDPYWSPLLGHARRVPRAVDNTIDRWGGRPSEVGPLPSEPNDRYFWWDFLDQVDIWWLWLPSAELPRWLWLLVPVFASGAAGGVIVLRSGLREPATAR